MKSGKAFEMLVKYILIGVGFKEVVSDGSYIFGGASTQKINGMGEAHDADVLLEPPVQIPFSYLTRLLIECKDYGTRKRPKKVGMDVIRGVLGLRDDINAFNIVDDKELKRRMSQKRSARLGCRRYNYNVAVASTTGFSDQAQNMAAAYRIPLIEFTSYPFWRDWKQLLPAIRDKDGNEGRSEIINFVKSKCAGMAVAVTNTSQLLFFV